MSWSISPIILGPFRPSTKLCLLGSATGLARASLIMHIHYRLFRNKIADPISNFCNLWNVFYRCEKKIIKIMTKYIFMWNKTTLTFWVTLISSLLVVSKLYVTMCHILKFFINIWYSICEYNVMSHIDTLCINITMFYIFNIMHCYDRLMYLLLLQFVCNIICLWLSTGLNLYWFWLLS